MTAHDPGRAAVPRRTAVGDTPAYVEDGRRPSPSPSCSRRCARPPRGYVALAASQPGRPRGALGAEQHRLGGRRARGVVRRRRRSSRSTRRYTGHEVADLVDRTQRPARRGGRRVPRPHPDRRPARRRASSPRCARSSTSPTSPTVHGRRPRATSTPSPSRSSPTTSPTSCSPPARPAGPRARCRAHRQTVGVARAWGELGGVTAERPLPRGQPVLPLLRLQGRDRGRPADRRHALPGRHLRPRRDDAADRGRADHRAARARRRSTSRCSTRRGRADVRPVVAAARGDRRRRRTGRAHRADAAPSPRASASTRSSPPSG